MKPIVLIIVFLFATSAGYAACRDGGDEPGSEIVCPAEARPVSQDLKEKGLGIADMPIIDELECRATDDKTGHVTYGWCEHRKADDKPLVYIVIYTDQTKEEIKLILIHNPVTKEIVVFYDYFGKKDI